MNFLPVIDVVRAAFGIEEGMTEEEVTNRIVVRATDSLSPMIPFFQNLLSLKVDDPRFTMLNPEGRKFGTFEAVKNLLLAVSAEKPLVVFLEDVHWIDKISEELFAFFSRCILDIQFSCFLLTVRRAHRHGRRGHITRGLVSRRLSSKSVDPAGAQPGGRSAARP